LAAGVLHGDWTRCLGKGVLNRGRNKNKSVGVFFDPPYRRDCCESERLYAHSGDRIRRTSAIEALSAA
jgi:hypothetical protein